MGEAVLTSDTQGVLGRVLRHPRLFLVLICLVLWTPGIFSLPPLDRDESRFAQSSKQMLESGNFVDIRIGAVPRYKKPVGIYWVQATTTAVADAVAGVKRHDRIWTYRLTSLIGATTAVCLTYWVAIVFAGVEASFLAALLMAMTLLLTGEATIATTDAALLACLLGAQGYFLRVYHSVREGLSLPRKRMCLAGWAALGLGTLIKGPMALAVSGLTLLSLSLWDREGRWLTKTRPLLGLLVVLLIVLPWAVAIGLISHGGFYDQSLGHDFAAKLAGGQESHGAPPGYFLALLPITYWPATLFLLQGIGEAVRRRFDPGIRFLVAWIVPAWLMFELVPTKLPHYILPVYPALAILAALWMTGPKKDDTLFCRVLSHVSPVLYAAGVLALTIAAYVLPASYGNGAPPWLIFVIVAFVLVSIIAIVAYARKLMLTATLAMLVSVLIFYPALTAGVAPGLERIWVSPRLAAAVQARARPDDPPPAAAGYVEPSLMFLLGSDTRLTDGPGAAEAGASQGGLALVEERHRAAFLHKLAEREADAKEVGAVDGLNYSRGKPVHIRIYRVEPVREWAAPPSEE
jgi:4-amino-4-deoxy-L-arabinose transferase-like glycosyltransferase